MSFFFPEVEKIYVYKRKGTQDDPYVPISESLKVVNSRVILKEVPDLFTKVTVKDSNGNFLYETTSLTPNANEYRVDYSLGIVYFNSSNEGKEFTFDYQGVGLIAFPASRIWTRESNGEITETLQTLIDTTTIARDNANEAADNATTQAQYAQTQANYAKTQGDYAQEKAELAATEASNLAQLKTEVQNATTSANNATTSATNAANNANTAANNANDAANNANTKATYAQQQGDYAKTQGDYAKGQGDYAKTQGDYAKTQGDYAKQVGYENKTRWLTAVNTYADIATTYPNPQLGDTVQTIDDSKIYRWDGTQWVWTQQYNANAITDVQNKIGILNKRVTWVSLREYESYATKDGNGNVIDWYPALQQVFSVYGGEEGTGYRANRVNLLVPDGDLPINFDGDIIVPINIRFIADTKATFVCNGINTRFVFRNPQPYDASDRSYVEYWPYFYNGFKNVTLKGGLPNRQVKNLLLINNYIGAYFEEFHTSEADIGVKFQNTHGLWTEYNTFKRYLIGGCNTNVLFDANIQQGAINPGTPDGSFAYNRFYDCSFALDGTEVGLKVTNGAIWYGGHAQFRGNIRANTTIAFYIENGAIDYVNFDIRCESFGGSGTMIQIDNGRFCYNSGFINNIAYMMRNKQNGGDVKGNTLFVVGLELKDENGNVIFLGDQKLTVVDDHLEKRTRFLERTKGDFTVGGRFFANSYGYGGSHYTDVRRYVGTIPKDGANTHEKIIVKLYGGGWEEGGCEITYIVSSRGGLKISKSQLGYSSASKYHSIEVWDNGTSYDVTVLLKDYWAWGVQAFLVAGDRYGADKGLQEIYVRNNYDTTGKTNVTPTITENLICEGGDVRIGNGGGWNTGHIKLGSYHLWVDSTGKLRIKNGAPTSDQDGIVVGTQA